jgi:hypothetical protein
VTDTEARPLSLKGPNEGIDPGARFEIDLPRMADVRVRLIDSARRAVPSSDRLSSEAATRYELKPSTPLDPGSRYSLLVDGLSNDFPVDAAGRQCETALVELKTSGEKPRPAPGPRRKRR